MSLGLRRNFFPNFFDYEQNPWASTRQQQQQQQQQQDFFAQHDLSETNDSYLVSVELPGVKYDEVDLSLGADGRVLTISGNKKVKHSNQENIIHRLRQEGRFTHSVTFPESVDAKCINACLDNGVLCIKVAKTEATKIKISRRQGAQEALEAPEGAGVEPEEGAEKHLKGAWSKKGKKAGLEKEKGLGQGEKVGLGLEKGVQGEKGGLGLEKGSVQGLEEGLKKEEGGLPSKHMQGETFGKQQAETFGKQSETFGKQEESVSSKKYQQGTEIPINFQTKESREGEETWKPQSQPQQPGEMGRQQFGIAEQPAEQQAGRKGGQDYAGIAKMDPSESPMTQHGQESPEKSATVPEQSSKKSKGKTKP